LLLFGFGLVASATLVPTAAALEGYVSEGVCDTSRIGIASMRELTTVNVTSLNVLLFVPLGVAVGLLPWSRAAAIAALAAFSLTFAVETFQLLLPVLGRGCQTADMIDNLFGLTIGLVIGASVRLVVPRHYLERPTSPRDRSDPD
jgi:glycopeptide antibiotics resistance protein